jgi:endoglucanase
MLLVAIPLALVAIVACSAPTAQPTPETSTDATPRPAAPPEPTAKPAPPTLIPSSEPVSLGEVTHELVLVDQVGYLPSYPKIALVANATATQFEVVDTATRRSVYAAYLGEPQRDLDSGQSLRAADFSAIQQPGTYTIVVPGVGRSPDFRIANDVYAALAADALESYDELAILAPPAWHSAKAKERESGKVLDVSGGWPDAGDYGRYMPSAAGSVATMLLLADLFPDRMLADHLQVLRREIDWMLKMQREDGAVYHKVTPLKFGGFDKGSDNIGGELFVFDASTPDAAVFAAVMASASRVYRDTDSAYADRLLAAAERSWQYLVRNPKPNLPAELEGTGAYLYSGDSTQRFWAAAELFNTTAAPEYAEFVKTFMSQRSPTVKPLGWHDATTYALLSIAFNDHADATLRSQVGRMLTTWADGMATTVSSPVNPFAVSLGEYKWASNRLALDNAVLLLIANRITPNERYRHAALDQLHYVLGRNTLGKSFVTSYGANSVKNPHNRTTFALGRLVPGVLVGGPNDVGQDGITPKGRGQRSYVDELQAYASNENSVEYNAPLVTVTALFSRDQT